MKYFIMGLKVVFLYLLLSLSNSRERVAFNCLGYIGVAFVDFDCLSANGTLRLLYTMH
jgi:hypothetical protein